MAQPPSQTGGGPTSILDTLAVGNNPLIDIDQAAIQAEIAALVLPPPSLEVEEDPDPCAAKRDNKIEINQ